jgi:hypothetical protein
MNMLIFNFHKIMNVHKGYAYQFSDFITYKKPRIDVCVSARTMHSKKAVIYCKAQSAKHKHLIVLLLLHTLIPNA